MTNDTEAKKTDAGNNSFNGYYLINCYCTNCDYKGAVTYPKGTKVAERPTFGGLNHLKDKQCPRCENTTLSRSYQL